MGHYDSYEKLTLISESSQPSTNSPPRFIHDLERQSNDATAPDTIMVE